MECFKINLRLWKLLGVYPLPISRPLLYEFYSKIFIAFFDIFYVILYTINLFFMPNSFEYYVNDLLFYFTIIASITKVFSFVFKKKKIQDLIKFLESDMFQPETITILKDTKNTIKKNFKIYFAVSALSNVMHIVMPMVKHLLHNAELVFPVSSYCFLSDNIRQSLAYPIYFYQSFGIHFLMLCNVNIDTFIVGLMMLLIAQLKIIRNKLMNVTEDFKADPKIPQNDEALILKLNKIFQHYHELTKFCSTIEDVFSISIFMQFSMGYGIICMCLTTFTMNMSWQYYIFLSLYTLVMVVQIFAPCVLGNRIIDKSSQLQQAMYGCDWIPRSKRFKSSMRLFIERTSRPLSITGWKMFPLSLKTFTSIMNSAYSFFTLLRNMK